MDQDQNTQQVPQMDPLHSPEKRKSTSMMIGLILLVIVVVISLLFTLIQKDTGPVPTSPTPSPSGIVEEGTPLPETDPATTALSAQGTSDEIDAIEADLNATDLDVLSDTSGI